MRSEEGGGGELRTRNERSGAGQGAEDKRGAKMEEDGIRQHRRREERSGREQRQHEQ